MNEYLDEVSKPLVVVWDIKTHYRIQLGYATCFNLFQAHRAY